MRGVSAAPAVDTGAEVDAVLVPPLVEGLAEAPEAVAVVAEAVLDAVPALLVSDALLVSVAVVSVLVADFVPVVLVRVLAIHQHLATSLHFQTHLSDPVHTIPGTRLTTMSPSPPSTGPTTHHGRRNGTQWSA